MQNRSPCRRKPPPRRRSPFSRGPCSWRRCWVRARFCFFSILSTHGFYPVCLFHELTGLNCPGCGGTRAAYQLLHGHLLLALRDNALFILTVAALTLRGVWFIARKIRHQPATLAVPPKTLWAFLVVAVVFSVLRNLPAFSFLSP